MYGLWVMLPVSAVVVLVTAPRPPRILSTISLHVVDVHQIRMKFFFEKRFRDRMHLYFDVKVKKIDSYLWDKKNLMSMSLRMERKGLFQQLLLVKS